MPVFDRALYATDLSVQSEKAFAGFLDMPGPGSGEVRLLYVMDKDDAAEGFYEVEARAARELDLWKERLARRGVKADCKVREGVPADEIVREASEWGATLIVMGAGRMGLAAELLVGNVAVEVLKETGTPTLALNPPEEEGPVPWKPLRKALVPLDFTGESLAVLESLKEAAFAIPEVVLSHVVEGGWTMAGRLEEAEKAEARLRELASSFQEAGMGAAVHVHAGHATKDIIEMAEEEAATLIVLAGHERPGLLREAFGGSTAERVLRRAKASVLFFPKKG